MENSAWQRSFERLICKPPQVMEQVVVFNETSRENISIRLEPFNGTVWRIMFESQLKQACEPFKSPVGRFHHDGQVALYSSCSREGAGVAIKRYLTADDPARVIVPLEITAERVFDIRKTQYSKNASVVWQDIHAAGRDAPTWEYSDYARQAGAQGMLYASRSRPELTHLVLFDVSAEVVKQGGEHKSWCKTES